MIKLGSNKLGTPSWRNQNILSDQDLKNIYGKQAVQYLSQKNILVMLRNIYHLFCLYSYQPKNYGLALWG